jgi:NTE family protein
VTTAIILGGGAPNLTLMSGALAAFAEKRAKFDVIAASGAGMLVALLYATNLTKEERLKALESTRDMGVSDEIYDWF